MTLSVLPHYFDFEFSLIVKFLLPKNYYLANTLIKSMSSEIQNYANWSDSEESDEDNPTKTFSNHERRCKYCVKLVKSSSDIPEHEKKCSTALKNTADLVTCKDGSNRFLCDICFRFFKYLTGLNKHKKWHEPPGGFVCRHCDAKYCTSQDLERHKQESHQVYKCQVCKRILETLQSYLDHIRLEHDGLDRVWVHCDDCGLNFKSQSILSYHKRTKCGTIKPFKCDECGSHYQTQATLIIHKLIHKGEKSFCCSFCGKSFLSKGQLTVHERKHTGEKPYKCEVCSKSFSYRESLVTHSSLHTGIKPYVCEACDARFSCVGNLQKHRRTRPNSCGLPQYCINKKAAPRASSRIPGTLTMSNVKITKANKVIGLKNEKMSSEPEVINEGSDKNYEIIEKESMDFTEIEDNKKLSEMNNEENDPVEKENTVQMLDIQILDNPHRNDEPSILNYESTVNCYVVNAENEFKVIPVSSKVPSETKQEDPVDKEGAVKNIEYIEKKTNPNPIYVDTEGETNASVYEENDIDSGGYDQYNTETEHYNEEEMMFVIMMEDDADEEENLPLSVIKDTIENTQNENSKNSEQEEMISDPLNPSINNIGSERCTATDSDTEVSEEDEELNRCNTSFLSTKDSYECHLCPKIYHHRRSFLKHLHNDHNIYQPELDRSAKNVRRKRPPTHVCTYCNKPYSKPKSLEKHLKCHGPEGKLIYKSACCSRYFETAAEATNHDRSSHSDIITCSICGKVYPNRDRLGAHKRYAHMMTKNKIEDKKKFSVCQKCGKKFTSKTALSDHERSDCGKSPLYKCDVCEKHFHSAGSLKTHKTVHTGELPHLCNYCGKAFRTFGQVKVHQRKHNGEKPFKCETCSKAFAYRESLLTHVSVHTGVKRFMCEGCGRRFSCISNLLMHRKYNQATCGAISSSTKPLAETMGVARGVLYVGEKPE